MFEVFLIAACAVLMRIKGGGIVHLDIGARAASALFFAVILFFSGLGATSIFAGIAWFFGCTPAVRDYITNVGGYRGPLAFHGFGQHKWIVKIIDFLFSALNPRIDGYKLRRFYGFIGCALRGLMLGVPLAAVFASPFPLLGGALMGPAYWLGISISQFQLKRRSINGWQYGEYLWGAAIGASICLSL